MFSSFFTIDFKICLYARRFDTSHCLHDIFWLHLVNSPKLWENYLITENLNEVHWHILFSQSFEELAKCSQNMSCGQCEVSKCLAYRHILKSVVKKLEEKKQKLSFSKLDLSLSVHMQSAVLLPRKLANRLLPQSCQILTGWFFRLFMTERNPYFSGWRYFLIYWI